MKTVNNVSSSFRDPHGFLFIQDGTLYRQINTGYREHFEHMLDAGLYEQLTQSGLLIPHQDVSLDLAQSSDAYAVIQPERVPFISYPYDWSFSQLKDAALATLAIQKRAVAAGMTLIDANAYNIQFVDNRPVLVDTLSFEIYTAGSPWLGYRQFCQHFLAPLALMHYTDVRLSQMLRTYIDGIPLDLAAKLLPRRSKLNPGILMHIQLHASAQSRYADKEVRAEGSDRQQMSRQSLLGLIDNLESTIKKWSWDPGKTAWADYYNDDSYTEAAFVHKQALVRQYLEQAHPEMVVDLGGNLGVFSRIANEIADLTISVDYDPGAVELNYRQAVQEKTPHYYPLVVDLTNPSGALGWGNVERDSFLERAKADTVLALALIHHLAIGNNVPLGSIAAFCAELAEHLIIEFVPKSDHKVKTLLASRRDVFPDYTKQGFEEAFLDFFTLIASEQIQDSERHLYLLKRK